MVVKFGGKEGNILNYDSEIVGVPNKGSLLERTVNGGIQFTDIQDDEFGNIMRLTIELTGTEIEVIKKLIQDDLI